ncbi:MAG: DUF2269 family protein [Azospirillaceae bacterium]
MLTRQVIKILHTLGACGLIGGLAAYMILLLAAPQDSAAAYADLRASIAVLADYVLLPSLALALVTGLFSMAAHGPFRDKGWAWLKAALGILMFKGTLTIIGAKADYAAGFAARIAEGEAEAAVLAEALAYEWHTLITVMALSVANVVLGIWRPRLGRKKTATRAGSRPAEALADAATRAPGDAGAAGAAEAEGPRRVA